MDTSNCVHFVHFEEECVMGRSNKSKRFVKQGTDAVQLHDQRIPYHMTLAEAEQLKAKQNHSSSPGGRI